MCETELGIVSQCCQPGQAKKLSKQYFENIALKINVKVCGIVLSGCVTVILFVDLTWGLPIVRLGDETLY